MHHIFKQNEDGWSYSVSIMIPFSSRDFPEKIFITTYVRNYFIDGKDSILRENRLQFAV